MASPTAPAAPAGVDVSQVASLLNLTPRRVQQLAKEGVIPKPERGRYQIAGCVRGYIAYLQKSVETATNKARQPLLADLASQQARKMAADARKSEIEVELLERTMIRVGEADAVVAKLLTDLRAAMMPFPRVAAPKLLGAKSVQELEQRLHLQVVRMMEGLAAPSFGEEEPPAQEQAA
jgi:hypothetical protein